LAQVVHRAGDNTVNFGG